MTNYVAYVFIFLVCIRCKKVVICHTDSTCNQQPSQIQHSLLHFATFPLAIPPLLGGHKPAVGGPGCIATQLNH